MTRFMSALKFPKSYHRWKRMIRWTRRFGPLGHPQTLMGSHGDSDTFKI